MRAKLPIFGLCLLLIGVQSTLAQTPPKTSNSSAEQEVITLSKDKWRWMSERNVEALANLFADEAVFVHMGGTMSKSQELEVIKSGTIQYKDAQYVMGPSRLHTGRETNGHAIPLRSHPPPLARPGSRGSGDGGILLPRS